MGGDTGVNWMDEILCERLGLKITYLYRTDDFQVARLIPDLIDGLKEYRGTERYEHLLRIDGKFRLIISQLPRYLDEHHPFDPQWPDWIHWARRILPISAADKVSYYPFRFRWFLTGYRS